MILVFGSINLDLVARVRAIPQPGETVLSERYETGFGGKGANQAVAAARGRRDTAMPVLMAGAVGVDAFGDAAIANFAAEGIDTTLLRRHAEWPTGCAFITVAATGENAITVASGANLTLRAADVPAALLAQMRVLVLQMEVPPAESLALAERACAQGVTVLLNLAPAPDESQAALLPPLLTATDILVVNEHEAVTTLGLVEGADVPDPVAATARLATHLAPAGIGIVTLGAEGAVACGRDGWVTRVSARPVQPVDTTGAGDTFVGLLAAALAEATPLEAALQRACIGASLACMVLGAQPGMPRAADLDQAAEEA